MNPEDLSGVRKAAILLLTMDDEVTKDVMKGLDEEEIEAIGKEITNLKLIPDHVVHRVQEEFMTKVSKKSKNVVGGESKFRLLVKKSFDEDRAEMLLGNLDTKKGVPGEFLKRCDARVLANVIREEHPQTMALVLSVLGTKKAGDAISCLPERVQADVVVRMANLEKVDLKILSEVESVIRDQLESTMGGAEGKQLGGVEVVASILNQMDRTLESELLGRLEETNPELAEKIRQLMFTFEDLANLDDRSIQVLLKEVSSEDIGIALKGASDSMKEKIYSNMSERAAAMLKEDLEAMGPVRLSDVEKAQVKIAMIAKKLESEGKIFLSRGNEEFI
ncbi:MAG: flagellar motor switch protein FliG [Syntrophorhabdus sp.]|jgi:flagellar motor switch protein FliG|nr:flagellar motor switch protein FliG [Syntrophorhabdus sp.]